MCAKGVLGVGEFAKSEQFLHTLSKYVKTSNFLFALSRCCWCVCVCMCVCVVVVTVVVVGGGGSGVLLLVRFMRFS